MKRLMSICLILLCSVMPNLANAENQAEDRAIDQLVSELTLVTD